MGEINHFSHEQHPMKLVENWEKIVGMGDEEQGVIECYCCRESISGDSVAYGCIECRYFLHKACAELEPTLNHHLHPDHTLTLVDVSTLETTYWFCDVCGRQPLPQGFLYACFLHPIDTMFTTCIDCYVKESARKVKMAALRKEATMKLELHEGHPHHTLTFKMRKATFRCDACKVKDKDYFYQCDDCDFWIHKTCASLAPTIDLPHHPDHPLVLVYSLPDNCRHYTFTCELCEKFVRQNDWLYHCANCRYFAHIKCALNPPCPPTSSNPCDVEEEEINGLMRFPMLKEALKDPLKLLQYEKTDQDEDDKEEISHWSHNHELILNVEPRGHDASNIDAIEVCNGCVRPISLPHYGCKDGCMFTLHKYCAKLPLTLKHQLHPDHLLHLVDTRGGKYYHRCNGCYSYGNAFAYKCETCMFFLDINCAFLPNTIKHESHKHPLIQLFKRNILCKACNRTFSNIGYACNKDCDFQLDMMCALQSPSLLAHRYCKGHEIPLTYPPVKDHPEDFYCDICEEEMHPKFPLYHCLECKNSFHLHCLSRADQYENVLHKGIRVVNYHKHPLTYVRRKKTPQYICFDCNQDINGQLILECRTGTCPYRICFTCHRKKRR